MYVVSFAVKVKVGHFRFGVDGGVMCSCVRLSRLHENSSPLYTIFVNLYLNTIYEISYST
jgi:hypothetical protein